MRANRLFLAFATFLVALPSLGLAGWCQKCTMTCNYVVPQTWVAFDDPFHIANKITWYITSANPHKDCKGGGVLDWCTSSGSVKCCVYDQETYSYALGRVVSNSYGNVQNTGSC
ncbi:hypothetical protein BH11ARM2_BH11ARM2_21430 [soil metagenome]